jgi:hypothetical protein
MNTDDYVSGRVTMVDEGGRSLIIHKIGPRLFFSQRNGKKIESKPGSPEEQHLLRIMEESFAKVFNPLLKMPKLPIRDEKELNRYFDQLGVKHIIIDLQRRCATKKEVRLPGDQ